MSERSGRSGQAHLHAVIRHELRDDDDDDDDNDDDDDDDDDDYPAISYTPTLCVICSARVCYWYAALILFSWAFRVCWNVCHYRRAQLLIAFQFSFQSTVAIVRVGLTLTHPPTCAALLVLRHYGKREMYLIFMYICVWCVCICVFQVFVLLCCNVCVCVCCRSIPVGFQPRQPPGGRGLFGAPRARRRTSFKNPTKLGRCRLIYTSPPPSPLTAKNLGKKIY